MLREGHIGITLAIISPIALIISAVFPVYMGVIVLAGALTGSNLPDIDTSIRIVKHRGFTHTFWFAGIASVASSVFMYITATYILVGIGSVASSVFTYITATYIPPGTVIQHPQSTQIVMSILFGGGVGLGVITHLLGDVITPTGIKPYHPVTPRDTLPVSVSEKKYVYEIAKASNKKYNAGFSILGVLSASISAVIGITVFI